MPHVATLGAVRLKIDHEHLIVLLQARQASERPTLGIAHRKASGVNSGDQTFEFHVTSSPSRGSTTPQVRDVAPSHRVRWLLNRQADPHTY